MKKFVIGLLALCLIIGGIFGLTSVKHTPSGAPALQAAAQEEEKPNAEADSPESSAGADTAAAELAEPDQTVTQETAAMPEESPSTVPDEPSVASGRLNYEALYELYAPEEKVLRVEQNEETWGDYFYVLFTQAGQIEDYFDAMAAYYGMQFGWTDSIEEDEEGETYIDAALESADSLMIQLNALELFAERSGVEVSEEMQAMIEAQMDQDVLSALGEEGTKDAFLEYLKTIHLSEDMYGRIVTQNFLYQESFKKLYGEKSEKLPDEDAVKYLEDGGYITAAHILFLNSDDATGEALDDTAQQEKKSELEAVLAELRAIEDPQERKEAFLQRASEISEDPGSSYYPEGYTYTPGTMVTEFEEAAEALGEYEISDVVETSYGYHIIMRLPLSPDAIVEFSSSTGEARTARMLAANQAYAEQLQELADSLSLEWLPEHHQPDLLAYIAA